MDAADWALCSAHHDRIYRYVLGIVRNRAAAEDFTQETFLRAFTRVETLRDPNAARGWLYRVATNVCLDHLRKPKPEVSIDGGDAGRPVPEPPTQAPSAEEIAERKETSACVQRCLELLSDSYRAALLMHDVHGLSAVEIARVLGVETGAVKIRLHRARLKLHQIMQQGCSVSEDKKGIPGCQPKCGEAGQSTGTEESTRRSRSARSE